MVAMHLLLWPILLAFLASAQTFTTIDPISGETIVEVVSTAQGIPVTSTVSTLTGLASTTSTSTTSTTLTTRTSTSTTTTPNNQQGPVGQPAATTATPGAPTPFTYTTIVNGQTVVATDVFTPTNPTTIPFEPTGSGAVWELSSYIQQYGPTTGTGGAASAKRLGAIAFGLIGTQIGGLLLYLFF